MSHSDSFLRAACGKQSSFPGRLTPAALLRAEELAWKEQDSPPLNSTASYSHCCALCHQVCSQASGGGPNAPSPARARLSTRVQKGPWAACPPAAQGTPASSLPWEGQAEASQETAASGVCLPLPASHCWGGQQGTRAYLGRPNEWGGLPPRPSTQPGMLLPCSQRSHASAPAAGPHKPSLSPAKKKVFVCLQARRGRGPLPSLAFLKKINTGAPLPTGPAGTKGPCVSAGKGAVILRGRDSLSPE